MTEKTVEGAAEESFGKIAGRGIGIVLNGAFGVLDYRAARKEGNGVITSAAKAVTTMAVAEMLGWWMLPISMAPAIGAGMLTAGEHTDQAQSKVYDKAGKLGSGYVNMTDAGYTMRQRSINAIRANGLNLNSVFGNEARTYYMNS